MSSAATQLASRTAELEALSLDSTGVAVPTLLRYGEAVFDSHRKEEGLCFAVCSFCGGIRALQAKIPLDSEDMCSLHSHPRAPTSRAFSHCVTVTHLPCPLTLPLSPAEGLHLSPTSPFNNSPASLLLRRFPRSDSCGLSPQSASRNMQSSSKRAARSAEE